MTEDPSLPPPFSRMEIATIAAMLLGEISEDIWPSTTAAALTTASNKLALG
jgi:hypothetical protein